MEKSKETPKRRFYIKFTGAAFGIEAATPEDAIKQIRNNMDCYSTITTLEIGVDVDELGWPIKKAAGQ